MSNFKSADHQKLKVLLERIVQKAVDGEVTVAQAAAAVHHLLAAADLGDFDEIRKWFEEPDRVLGNWSEGMRATQGTL